MLCPAWGLFVLERNIARLVNLALWLLAIAFIAVLLLSPEWIERAAAWAGLG